MILDATGKLAAALDLTGSTSTLAAPLMGSTYMDEVVIEDWGMGNTIVCHARINTVLAASSSGGTTQLVLCFGSTSAKVTTGGTPDLVVPISKVILQANYATDGAANTTYDIKLPRGTGYRYIGIGAAIITNALTTGKLDAWLLNEAVQDNKSYPGAFTVK
jgi:hypothetical protein